MPALLDHDAHPCALPITPSVSFRTTDPIRRVRSRHSNAAMLGAAGLRAVQIRGTGVPGLPRLLEELAVTVDALEADRSLPARVGFPDLTADLETRPVRTLIRTERVGSCEALASRRAESPAPALGLRFKHLPPRATVLAGSGQPDGALRLLHSRIIPGFMGIGSTAFVAIEQGRIARGFELKESYHRQALKNAVKARSVKAGPKVLDLFSALEAESAS